MTRAQIEAQIRADNPTTAIDGVEYGQGAPEYEALLAQWADAMEAQQNAATRGTARTALRNAWGALAPWIRGPFHTQFLAVQDLLDLGQDDAAEALIEYAQAPADYDAEQLSAFATFKSEFTAAIAALPSL